MPLKQMNATSRIIFLKRFSSELVINSGKPELIEKQIRKKIEVEKLKQKFLKPIGTKNEGFKQINVKGYQPSVFQNPVYSKSITVETKPVKKRHRLFMHRKPKMMPKPLIQQPELQKPTQPVKSINTSPTPQPRPQGLVLGKLEPLLKDKSIQSLECPGPGKNVLIKRHNQINATKITLSQEDISNTINSFAQEAKIPVMGGILKAAVGDLIISAVISEFVGSRFILNKINPYNLIQ